MALKKITTEEFDEAVRELAREEGVDSLLSIPGVWECVSEHFNNDAIDLVLSNREAAESENE